MSVKIDNDTDKLTATAGAALTIGTGDFYASCWFKYHTDFAVTLADPIFHVGDAEPETTTTGFGIGTINSATTDVSGIRNLSPSYTTGYAYTTNVWYGGIVERSGTTFRFRVFDDSVGTSTLHDVTVADSATRSDLDTFVIGAWSGMSAAAPIKIANFKIHTGVALSDSEARTELRYFGIQKAGGTDRYCWRLKGITTDTDGLYEIGGAGPNFTNSGAVTDADMPINLSEFGTLLGKPTRIDQLGNIQTRIGPSERNVFNFNV